MNRWYKTLTILASLPGLAAAADRDMMNLIMPEATMVLEVNLARIMASPAGAAIGDAFRQGVSAGISGQLAHAQPQMQAQVAALGKLDWSHDVQDILMAAETGKSSSALLIVRSSLDKARLEAMNAFGQTTDYEGVPIYISAKPGNGVFAFLDHNILLLGQMPDVQAAIRRRNRPLVLSPALAAQVTKYSGYDFWLAFTGTIPVPSSGGLNSMQGSSIQGAQAATQFLAKMSGFNGGIRFSPDLELSADIQTRTEKDAGEMASGLLFLSAAARQAQAKNGGGNRTGLESLKCTAAGRHILLSLQVPEEQLRAGIAQMRAQMRAQMQTQTHPQMQTQMQVPSVSQSEAASRRANAPPPGTIRVESSEGTMLIQTGKDQ